MTEREPVSDRQNMPAGYSFFIILGEEDSDFYKSETNSPLCVIKVLSRLQINFFK